jgi:hypothetical protein
VNCQQFEIFLDQYLDGDLDGTLKLEFETHLVQCETCGHLYAMMEAAGQIIADDDPQVPVLRADFTDRVIAGVAKQKRKTLRIHRWVARSTVAAAIAMIVLGLVVVNSFGPGKSPAGSTVAKENGAAPLKIEQRLLAMNDFSADRRNAESMMDSKKSLVRHIKSSAIERQLHQQDQEEISSWLASKLERAGSNLKEITELRTTAWDQMRQGLFQSFSTPMMPMESYLKGDPTLPTPSGLEQIRERVVPTPRERIELEAGVELL